METKLTMKELPETERPYEKMERLGPGALSDAELLSIILRNGTPKDRVYDIACRALAVAEQNSDLRPLPALLQMDADALKSIPGIGRVKVLQLQAVMEISRRLSVQQASDKLMAEDPETVADTYMQAMRYLRSEVIKVLYLNNQNRMILEKDLPGGSLNYAMLDTRLIFEDALRMHAAKFIVLHNHPGGDPSPSMPDIHATRRLIHAGQMMGIPLVDHIIIGDGTYYSMKEQGLLDEVPEEERM